MGAQLFQAAGRTDKTKLIVICPNFANAPKNDHDLCNVLYQHSATKYLRISNPETRFEPANIMKQELTTTLHYPTHYITLP